ncbi:MAG: GGDEF domain-containing protein, partial [Herbinix sp.]|nr:GGDEF domain-containing protein [Herbinix sp.]
YRPFNLFVSYGVIHTYFLLLLPFFNTSGDHLFSYYINSSSILIMSWAISCMRIKNSVEDFLNRKKIQEKSSELKRLNRALEEANHKLTQANRKLEKLSQTDSLTSIYNRSMFDKILPKEWENCINSKAYLSLVMIDIDFFKAFNDHYGYQAVRCLPETCCRSVIGLYH